MTEAGGCLLCAMEQADEQAVVFRDPLWAAEVVPGYDVPGWFILRARRHAERITGLDPDELSTLGLRARDLVAAVTEVTGAPATYLMVFGENYPHFHVLVAARAACSAGWPLRAWPEQPARDRAGDGQAGRGLVPGESR
jgi:diadenosine tetraphosphate (Ap4A) HIT family hydrolase